MNKNFQRSQAGFTLIELLTTIAIMSLLSSSLTMMFDSSRDKAKIAQAQLELRQLHLAIELLYQDTGFHPNKLALEPCGQDWEVFLNSCSAGLGCTDGSFPGWTGPYFANVPLDPWGTNYFFDPDYVCGPDTRGCNGVSQVARVIQSFGPNKAQEYGNSDDVVQILCIPDIE